MSRDFVKYTLVVPFYGIFLFTLSLFLSPITYDFNSGAAFVIYGFYFFYLVGWVFAWCTLRNNQLTHSKSYRVNQKSTLVALSRARLFFFYMTLFFLGANYFDFFVLGDVLNKGVVALREERTLDGQRGSIVGFVIVLLSGSPLMLLTLTQMLAKCGHARSVRAYSFVAALGCLAYLLGGGRNNFFLAIIFLSVYSSILTRSLALKKQRNSSFTNLMMGLVLLLTLIIFLLIFIERANFQGIDIRGYIETVDSEFDVDFYYLTFKYQVVEDFYYALMASFFYLNHSIIELSKYFNEGWRNHTYGVLFLPLVSMGFDQIFSVSSFPNAVEKMILYGVYLSFPGFLYLDFWYFYFLVPLIIGFAIPYFYQRALSRGASGAVSIYLYVLLVVIMIVSPVYNALAMVLFPVLIFLVIVSVMFSLSRVF